MSLTQSVSFTTLRSLLYTEFCRKIETISNNDQKHVSVRVGPNEVLKHGPIRNHIVRPHYSCVYRTNLSYFRARDLRRHLCRTHGKACDTLVQVISFPAVNSVLRNATVEEMIKHLGFTNQHRRHKFRRTPIRVLIVWRIF